LSGLQKGKDLRHWSVLPHFFSEFAGKINFLLVHSNRGNQHIKLVLLLSSLFICTYREMLYSSAAIYLVSFY